MSFTADMQMISEGMVSRLFLGKMELLPGVTEMYELELAFLESQLLGEEEIIQNGAYFASVGNRITVSVKKAVTLTKSQTVPGILQQSGTEEGRRFCKALTLFRISQFGAFLKIYVK